MVVFAVAVVIDFVGVDAAATGAVFAVAAAVLFFFRLLRKDSGFFYQPV